MAAENTMPNPAEQGAKLPVIAIVGRPNVGKSSLFNAAVGRRLSIVHEMPGVTRDRVTSPVIVDGNRFLLIDTGGLGLFAGEKRKVDRWDEHIASQVEIALGDADALVLVVNVQDGVTPLDEEVVRRVRVSGKPFILAVNKCDNPDLAREAEEFRRLGVDRVYPVSCLHKQGVEAALSAALARSGRTAAAATDGVREEAPFKIAVVGRPNVGKSSLVNALLGEKRVMVSEIAGTTRDAIDVAFTLQRNGADFPAVLIDTAGLRKNTKVDTVVELFSVMRAKSAISHADLVLFVIESGVGKVTAQDRRIANLIREEGKGCIIVANKCDLCTETARKELEKELRYELSGMDYAPVVWVSAKEERHLGELCDQICEVIDSLEYEIPTGVLNRTLADTLESHTPPVVGRAPLKLYYASMTGSRPPRALLFVNDPANCADSYLGFLVNVLRRAFQLVGVPLELKLRARPKKVQSIRKYDTARPAAAPGRPAGRRKPAMGKKRRK